LANWKSLSVEERRTARLASWASAKGLNFESKEAEASFRQRTKRVIDVIGLKKPDCVPNLPFIGNFVASYAGISMHDGMYNYNNHAVAYGKFVEDFRPEYHCADVPFPGRVFDRLDYRVYRWPGHGLPVTETYQTVEAEYMTTDEYDRLIADPEAYYMRTYLPRAFGALTGLQILPSLFLTTEIASTPMFFTPAGKHEAQEALRAILDAAREALDWALAIGKMEVALTEKYGMPRTIGGFTKAPFDIIGDTMRGTRGIALDKRRQPEKVIAACERIVPIAVRMGVETAGSDNPFVFIPLHKGTDEFMSSADFKKFYWPSFKATLLGLIDEGLVPFSFVEGAYNQRLDIIVDPDIPAGSTYWTFDRTDMREVKKKLGGWAAFGGNVPASLLYACTPQKVETYIKELIDDVAVDGGFALGTGVVVDHAKPENLHAMFDACRRYGVYK
jgi:uroporphyrinogen-III decarboxylase